MSFDSFVQYIKPELLVVAVALYFLGVAFKNAKVVKDNYIPLFLGVIGIVLCIMWVIATSEIKNVQDVILALFTAIVQGILLAGASTYVNQITKQLTKLK